MRETTLRLFAFFFASFAAPFVAGCAGAAGGSSTPREPVCYPRTEISHGCSGAEFSEEELARRAHEITVCDHCREDADCDARDGGRCDLLNGEPCEPAHRVCVYPDEVCYDHDRCDGRRQCLHEGDHAVCRDRGEPPP